MQPQPTQQLPGTCITALSGGADAIVRQTDNIKVLGLGGNFLFAVMQRALADTDMQSVYVQAQRFDRVERLVETNGVETVNVLNADGQGEQPLEIRGVVGAISLGKGATAGCEGRTTGRDELAKALTQFPIEVLSFSLIEASVNKDNPAVIALASALAERIKTNQNPLHLICTINLQENASKVKAALLEAAKDLGAGELVTWIENNLHVHNAAVDRMVWGGPGTEPDPTADVPYMPLVLERNTGCSLPAEFAAMIEANPFCCFTDNLKAWEQQKLLGANSSHTFMAAIGLLSGFNQVRESLDNDLIAGAIDRYVDGFAVPALTELIDVQPEGFEHAPFASGFVKRNAVACQMFPGFINQGGLDQKVEIRFSEFANQLADLGSVDEEILALAYASVIRANMPCEAQAVSSKDNVYRVAFDRAAEPNLRNQQTRDYLTGKTDADSLASPLALVIDTESQTYEIRSSLAKHLLGLWNQDANTIRQGLKGTGLLRELKIPDSLHDRVINLVIRLASDQREGLATILAAL